METPSAFQGHDMKSRRNLFAAAKRDEKKSQISEEKREHRNARNHGRSAWAWRSEVRGQQTGLSSGDPRWRIRGGRAAISWWVEASGCDADAYGQQPPSLQQLTLGRIIPHERAGVCEAHGNTSEL